MHLGSPDLCERVGDCLPGNDPPAVLAGDAVRALDEAQVSRGVVFSSAYLYGLADLQLSAEEIARLARLENEFTAAEVAGAGSRLVGFLSVDPLQPSAPEEIRYWRGSRMLVGLKLHFAAAGVDMGLEDHREQVAGAMRAASGQGMPIVVHVGGLAFDAVDAETFIESILPAAGDSWVQVAHAGGGYPFVEDRHVRVLETFADHLAADDSRTRRVLFDLSYAPAPEESAETVAALTRAMRRIGLERFLFGSDFNVLTPEQQIGFLDRLRLTPEEYALLRANCAPWVCGAHEQDVAPKTGGLDRLAAVEDQERRVARVADRRRTPPDPVIVTGDFNAGEDNRGGRYPSDHYPVSARLMLPDP